MKKLKILLRRSYILQELYHNLLILKYHMLLKNKLDIKVKTVEETLKTILENGSSISRFGDGEFAVLSDSNIDALAQKRDTELSQRLREILASNKKNHLVCICDAFRDGGVASIRNPEVLRYWKIALAINGERWLKYLNSNKVYYNANMTRFYHQYLDRKISKHLFEMMKLIWDKKEVLIVEGEKTRFGVGNDLLDNAIKVKRIIAPSRNAFSSYAKIMNSVMKNDTNGIVLIALGLTATVLAYDLHNKGYQAVDIGNADIEYEWFLRGVNEKIKIRGKDVAEAETGEEGEFADGILHAYQDEIIEYIP